MVRRTTMVLVGFLVVVGAVTLASGASATAPVASWPMFLGGPQHLSDDPTGGIGGSDAATISPGWTASLGGASDTSPAVAPDGSGTDVLYVADVTGTVVAYDAGDGGVLWRFAVPGKAVPVDSSPAVAGGVVYVASENGTLYGLDATTGALDCSFATKKTVQASPTVVADPDGSGPIVFVGSEAKGGEWAIYGVGNSHGSCTKAWEFTGFPVAPGGTWSSAAYGTDAGGEHLVVFGSKDDDDAVYAVDAGTGALVWRYQTSDLSEQDVGASPLIASPGVDGVASGAVFVEGKDCVEYALDLASGALLWSDRVAARAGNCVSSAALSGGTLVVGSSDGVFAVDAATGALRWHALGTVAVPSSPAVSDGPGGSVVVVTDNKGGVFALALATGAVLWSATPGSTGYLASPAVVGSSFYDVDLSGTVRTFSAGS